MHQGERKFQKQWNSLLWRSRVTSDHVSSSSGQLNLTTEQKTLATDPSQKCNIWRPIYLKHLFRCIACATPRSTIWPNLERLSNTIPIIMTSVMSIRHCVMCPFCQTEYSLGNLTLRLNWTYQPIWTCWLKLTISKTDVGDKRDMETQCCGFFESHLLRTSLVILNV